ncbi:ABC transporter permease [Allorhizobium undicola]|uniref:ABC transporter permease n=1 Tax=Allorhizobium undicola TaxID=78527 RepID=UPI003D335FD1
MALLLIRRLTGLVLTLLGVSLLIFAVMNLLPGDPAAIMLGTSASPDTLAALHEVLGLNRSLPLRFMQWLTAALTGNFGQSYTYGVPVSTLIAERLAVTVPLALMAIGLSLALALPLGVLGAARCNGFIDHLSGFVSRLFIAIPGFWTGLLLILFLAASHPIFPAGGFPGWQAGVWPAIKALVLPALALGLPQAGILIRVTRAAVLEVLNEDFVRTARAKGLPKHVALWRHAVPNALVPVVTMLGLQFTFLIAGAVLVENVFNLSGLGRLAYQALSQRDIITMQAVVLLFAWLTLLVNFLVDLMHLRLDPRLKSSMGLTQ